MATVKQALEATKAPPLIGGRGRTCTYVDPIIPRFDPSAIAALPLAQDAALWLAARLRDFRRGPLPTCRAQK